MARAPYKLPNVFVGCPYAKPFKFQQFKATLARLPFKFFYADTRLQTKHLLEILRRYIRLADFCIFDVSDWNANVSLELGLAEGLNTEYYILLHRRLTKGVPSDIQGIQRIEYSTYNDFDEHKGLLPLMTRYLVMEYTHPRRIWAALEGEERRHKMFYVAMRALAHLRDHSRLTDADMVRLSKGTFVRKPDRDRLLDTMSRLRVVRDVGTKRGSRLRTNLYREDIR